MTSFPCKGCSDRYVGCHGKCEKYIAAKNNREKELTAYRRDMEFGIYERDRAVSYIYGRR